MLTTDCRLVARPGGLMCTLWLLIFCGCASASDSELLKMAHVKSVDELYKHGFSIGLYMSESKLDELQLLLCYKHPEVVLERMYIAVWITHRDAHVFSSTRPAQSADDEGYFRLAFTIGKEFVEDSKVAFFPLANEEGSNIAGATEVPLPIIVGGAKHYEEAVSLLDCLQLAADN